MNDELTPERIAELGADLHALEAELAELLASSEEGAKPVDVDEPIGRVSRIDAIQQQKMLETNRRAASIRHSLVNVAIAAIRTGDYGLCKECEEPIGYRRLKARPETQLCLGCQHAREERR